MSFFKIDVSVWWEVASFAQTFTREGLHDNGLVGEEFFTKNKLLSYRPLILALRLVALLYLTSLQYASKFLYEHTATMMLVF